MPYPAIGIYTQKNEKNRWCCFFVFLCKRGTGGYAPCKPIYSSFHLEETWENGACGRPQAVLAMFLQTVRRKFASFGCLGSLYKTHTGVSAHLSGNELADYLRSRAETIKKLPELVRDRIVP